MLYISATLSFHHLITSLSRGSLVLRFAKCLGAAKFNDRYTLILYGRNMSASTFTFSKYSRESIRASAFTLFRTVPLIPIDALARAYSSYSGRIFPGSSSHFQRDLPAYPRSTVRLGLSQWLSTRYWNAGFSVTRNLSSIFSPQSAILLR